MRKLFLFVAVDRLSVLDLVGPSCGFALLQSGHVSLAAISYVLGIIVSAFASAIAMEISA